MAYLSVMTGMERKRLAFAGVAAATANATGLAVLWIGSTQHVDQGSIAVAFVLAFFAAFAGVVTGSAAYGGAVKALRATRGDHWDLMARYYLVASILAIAATLTTGRPIVMTTIAGAAFGVRFAIMKAFEELGRREPSDAQPITFQSR